MRNASALVCFLIIALGFGDAETLRPRRVKAFAARSSVAPAPQFAVPSGFQRINAGDVVTGTVIPSSTQIYYEVIAPANGTLMVTLNWDPSLGFLALVGQGAHFFYFPGSAPPTIAACPACSARSWQGRRPPTWCTRTMTSSRS